jgi:hypothetical protein
MPASVNAGVCSASSDTFALLLSDGVSIDTLADGVASGLMPGFLDVQPVKLSAHAMKQSAAVKRNLCRTW